MRTTRSITARLSLLFLLQLLLVTVLGVFSIGSLSYFNGVSSQVRDRWLPSTRVLGDLNTWTSDFRVAEATGLLAATPQEFAGTERQLDNLDHRITEAERTYTQIPHDSAEQALYARFAADWSHYRAIAGKVHASYQNGDVVTAHLLYNTASKNAYDAANDAFERLNDRNVANAAQASLRVDIAYARVRQLIVLTMVLAGLLVTGAMVYVRRSISAPLLALANRMHRLATNETGIEITGTERPDEIGEMARAVVVFRNNAIEVMTSRHGLQQQASMLQEKLTEEQRLMLLQRNFVTMASHEFRTPLTIIDGHAQRLIRLKDRLTPEDVVERAGKIRNAVLRMTLLIHNLIDSARVMDGDVELYFHPCNTDLALLLGEVCRLQREITPQAQIMEDFDERPLPMVGDSNLLFQVFSNLLSNAVKYSPGGGLVRLTAHCEGSHVRVSVDDEGIGVAEADRPHIFERYYRGSNTAGIVGTGVGLYFVRMVVELHGGEVTVESRHGKGSRFTVRLPTKPPHQALKKLVERLGSLPLGEPLDQST